MDEHVWVIFFVLNTHTHTHACKHTQTHTQTRTHAHAHIHAHACTHNTRTHKGVCKKPKNRKNQFKPIEPMQKFRFGLVLILLNKKLKSSVRFSVANFNKLNRQNRTEIYYYIIIYIKYIIFYKYLIWLWLTLCPLRHAYAILKKRERCFWPLAASFAWGSGLPSFHTQTI